MMMFQFSLRTLLITAVIAAIGCAALIHPTGLWRQAVVTQEPCQSFSATKP